MHRSILILLCMLFPVASGAGRVQKSSIPEKISGWIKVAPPKVGSEAWNAAVGSTYEWTVDTKEGLPVAHRRDPKAEQASALPPVIKRARGPHPEPGEIRSVKVVDGWLVSYNPEDGGGSLWWYGADGRQSYKVSNDQIRQFLPAGRGLFALEGLEQLKQSRGQIVQLQRNAQGQWTSTPFFDLERAPEVGMVESGGGFLVCTLDSLVRVSLDRVQTVLLPKAFWTGLSPRSITVSQRGDIYLGMRHGVAQVYPLNHTYVAEWFLPNLDFVHAKPK